MTIFFGDQNLSQQEKGVNFFFNENVYDDDDDK